MSVFAVYPLSMVIVILNTKTERKKHHATMVIIWLHKGVRGTGIIQAIVPVYYDN
jgi:hypothetical protein